MSVWTTLGIEATDDEAAIRRGYARALKAIDVDRDAAAFVALREAYDAAREEARWRRWEVEQGEPGAPDEAGLLPAQEHEHASPVRAEPVEALPLVLAGEEEGRHFDRLSANGEGNGVSAPDDDDFIAIARLIFGDEAREAIFARVQARFARIVADPKMDAIDHARGVEHWAASIILDGAPRSNALLKPAIDAFGWFERARAWNCPPEVQAVLRRYEDALWSGQVRDAKGSEVARAWALLEAPGAAPSRGHAELVDRFLTKVRSEHPTVEAELDAGQIAAWDAYFERRRDAMPARAGRRIRAGWGRVIRALPWLGKWRLWILLFVFLRLLIGIAGG